MNSSQMPEKVIASEAKQSPKLNILRRLLRGFAPRNYTKGVVWGGFLLLVGSLTLNALAGETPSASLGFDLTPYSSYLWRGLVFDEDPVLQTDFWMQYGRLTMTFWGNCDLTDEENDFLGQFNEWDTFINLDLGQRGPFLFGGGFYYNSFPASSGFGSSTAEVEGCVAIDVPTSPTLHGYWDIWQLHGVYFSGDLSQGFDWGPGSLCASAHLGWGDDKHNFWSGIVEAGGWLDLSGCLQYDWLVNQWLTLSPNLQYSRLLQEDIREYYDGNGISSSVLILGLNAGILLSAPPNAILEK